MYSDTKQQKKNIMSVFKALVNKQRNLKIKVGYHQSKTDNDLQLLSNAFEAADYSRAKMLIKRLSDVNCRTSLKTTPLMMFCQSLNSADENEALPVVHLLLERGCRIDKRDVTGKSAVEYARINRLQVIVKLLEWKLYDEVINMLI